MRRSRVPSSSIASREAATGTSSRTRATEARIITYAGSAATLAIVSDRSASSSCVYRSFVSGRRGATSVDAAIASVPTRSIATRRQGAS